MRLVETLLFCCLGAVIVVWATDRARGVDFAPLAVPICEGAGCQSLPENEDASPWEVFNASLQRDGLVAFSDFDRCSSLGGLLQTRAEEGETAQVLDEMQRRGIVAVSEPEPGTAIVAPGPRNDSPWDILRDGVGFGAPHGCFPSNFRPLFVPLLLAWVLLLGWRMVRYGRVPLD